MYVSAFDVRSANATIWSAVKSSFSCRRAVASILHSAEDLLWWRGCPNKPLCIDELISTIISFIPCNADALLEAELHNRLLLIEETEMSSSSAECLHFETAEKIMEEGWTGVDGGIELSLLDSGLLCTGVSKSFKFTGRVAGPIPLPVAKTVLPLGAVNAEFAMAPRVWSEGQKALMLMNIVMLYQPKRAKARHSYAIGDLYHSTDVLKPSHSLPVASNIVLFLQKPLPTSLSLFYTICDNYCYF